MWLTRRSSASRRPRIVLVLLKYNYLVVILVRGAGDNCDIRNGQVRRYRSCRSHKCSGKSICRSKDFCIAAKFVKSLSLPRTTTLSISPSAALDTMSVLSIEIHTDSCSKKAHPALALSDHGLQTPQKESFQSQDRLL